MKVTVVPQSQRQLQDWQERLKDAGCEFTITTKGKKVAIELDQVDAEAILGIEPKPETVMERLKRMPVWQRVLLIVGSLLFIGVINTVFGPVESPTEVSTAPPPEPVDSITLREQMIKDQFSSWDGSHIKLTRAVKNAMNDPKSFKHVKTMYSDNGDYILVHMEFRGSNAFGAIVLNEIAAKVDMDGNILEVIE